MRLFKLIQAVQIANDMFDNYVEPLGMSMMSGEVPQVMFLIHQRDSKDQDWLAQVRFKNTTAISVFKCELYLEDVFRLCRRCKLWLITEDIFRIVVLYAMIHPLFQSQYLDFTKDINADYDSMMAGAGKDTYRFIRDFYLGRVKYDPVEKITLDILKYHMMVYTNKTEPGLGDALEDALFKYRQIMMTKYKGAYEAARFRKAQMYLIDKDGFIQLEKRVGGSTNYILDGQKESIDDDVIEDTPIPQKRAYSIQPEKKTQRRKQVNKEYYTLERSD